MRMLTGKRGSKKTEYSKSFYRKDELPESLLERINSILVKDGSGRARGQRQ